MILFSILFLKREEKLWITRLAEKKKSNLLDQKFFVSKKRLSKKKLSPDSAKQILIIKNQTKPSRAAFNYENFFIDVIPANEA